MSHSLRRVWDQVSIYLPMILMGLMALGSWWLVRSTPSLVSATPEPAARHEPDYFMRNFSIKTFDATGRLKSEISGVQAHHFPDTDTVEIEQIRLQSYAEEGIIGKASADQALTNGDGSEVQLSGHARLLRAPGTDAAGREQGTGEFRSEFLHVYLNTERLKTHMPVQVLRGRDQFVADAMDYDNFEKVLSLRGHVRSELQAKPAR
jgi:lipopolysaccharide export system protein LptC